MLVSRAASLCYDSLLALVYPQSCAICSASVESRAHGVACSRCWQQTHIFTGRETLCWKCGLPSLGSAPVEKQEEVRCRRCDDLEFTAARACGVYEGALRASVLSLKRQPHACARVLALLVETQSRYPLVQATRIVPVPLHAEREKARGFNQAGLIARKLSLGSGVPLDDISLVRTSHTDRHRAGMDATDRRKTVDDAFRVVRPAMVAGERILLIDDVFTTGATVSSCAKALLEAGAAEVFVLTLARPVRR
ncbi:MAG: ComF family protein [Acidobacteriota bacterium]